MIAVRRRRDCEDVVETHDDVGTATIRTASHKLEPLATRSSLASS
jgi:hypothetical protein